MSYRFLIAVLVLSAPMLAGSGEVLDRLAATVNGHALLQSDVEEELRYEFFAARRPLSERSPADLKGALDRLIDQDLLREQMQSADFKTVRSEEVTKAFETFKSDYGAGASWPAALAAYGISEGTIRSHVEAELNQLRLIDLRLRPEIQIDPESVRTYYEKQLLPKLPPGQHPSLQEATPNIRELLVQQKMNESLDSWLEALRSQAQIERFGEAAGDRRK
jgi:hypothetical protein